VLLKYAEVAGVYVDVLIDDRLNLPNKLPSTGEGHAIAEFAKSLTLLTRDEEDFLERLQESIVWASRFPIPTKSSRYHDSISPVNKRRISTQDFEMAESLFQKLEDKLLEARGADRST
jgi:hypothetical protein